MLSPNARTFLERKTVPPRRPVLMFKRFVVLAALSLSSAVVAGAVGGTFANYLTDGNPITFLSGALPYSQGQNSTPGGIPIQLFSTTQGGETFAFDLTGYNAGFINNGAMGCDSGSTCLIVTGTGFFTGTGAVNF